MDPIRRKLLLAGLAGLLGATLAYLYLNSREHELLRRAQEVRAVTAARYIPAYTRLDQADWSTRSIPAEYLPKGAVTDPGDLKGLLTLAPFSAGEPILFNKLARSSQSLAAALPEGKRAFSVAVDAVTGVSGLIRPGDLVDVLVLTDGETRDKSMAATLFQATRVVAVGALYSNNEDKPSGESLNTVTLALEPRDCELLLFAQSRGRIQLTLRPPDDKNPSDLKAVNFSHVLSRLGRPSAEARTVEIIRGGK